MLNRPEDTSYIDFPKKADGSALSSASSEAVWSHVAAIGGDNRYYFANPLWTMRETIDWVVGGPGRTRFRSESHEICVGDAVDSWRVIHVDRPRRLALAFGMKAPGKGVLEFDIAPATPDRTRIKLTAYWDPSGFAGLLYWYVLVPVHRMLFDGMANEIARRAEVSDTR